MMSKLSRKINEIKEDIEKLKNKMIMAYKKNDYVDGNFYYKLLIEREKILSKWLYK